jgi:hypothetical protein
MKYCEYGNNYKHGDDVKYQHYIRHRESVFKRSSQNNNNNNGDNSTNNRYIGLEIYECGMYVGEEKYIQDFGGVT